MNLNQGTSPRWESTSFVFLFLFVSTSVKNRSELKAIRAIFCVFASKTFNCIFQASKRSKEAKVIFLQKIFKNPFFNLMYFLFQFRLRRHSGKWHLLSSILFRRLVKLFPSFQFFSENNDFIHFLVPKGSFTS